MVLGIAGKQMSATEKQTESGARKQKIQKDTGEWIHPC